MNPTGGLARRKTKLKDLAPANPLVVDSGNALFAFVGPTDPAQNKRAKLVLDSMASMGTRVMAVGHRDLNAGVEFLKKNTEGTQLTLLSANLMDGKTRPFAKSVIIKHQGFKVAFIGASPEGALPGTTLTGAPALKAVSDELATLGPRDVTIVLAAMPYSDSQALAEALKGKVDLVMQSHEGRGTQPPQKMNSGVYLLASGVKGKFIGQLELNLAGKGPLQDKGELAVKREQVQRITSQINVMEDRKKNTKDPVARGQIDQVLADFKARLAEAQKGLTVTFGDRTLNVNFFTLGTDVADDADMKAKVLEVEPTYMGGH